MITPETNIIKEGVHCPFCKTKEALLMSRSTFKKLSFQTPAFGLKFLLLVLYLPITVFLYGVKLFEITKGIVYDTYGFCPNCGNSYSAAPPDVIKKEAQEPKFYKNKSNGKITGLCAGIAEYTGLHIGWVRLLTTVYCLASFVMAVVAAFALIRAEAPFGDVFSAVMNQSIPTIAIGVLYFVISAFVPNKPTQNRGGNPNG
jgi:phage shock protein PspC (stress-responsive transcriptional regulator)